MAKILYFGDLPDRIGRGAEELFLPKTVSTTRGLLKYLRERGAAWSDSLQDDRLTITINKEFLDLDHPITDQDEIALISKGLGRS
ncbi:MAG: MoaD/ThiS family protein [Gammaproteobacteria bacterium]|nr:MoaD/ThiS family protein [Gammaproteobacteria bacterium]MBU2478926.1 MoaD/ThiS family protein [Gammaproteobacteria bacterium]